MKNEIIRVCKLDLFKDGVLIESEVKRIFRSVENAVDYIQKEVDSYLDAYSGEATLTENRKGFKEIELRGWVRRYYYVNKHLSD